VGWLSAIPPPPSADHGFQGGPWPHDCGRRCSSQTSARPLRRRRPPSRRVRRRTWRPPAGRPGSGARARRCSSGNGWAQGTPVEEGKGCYRHDIWRVTGPRFSYLPRIVLLELSRHFLLFDPPPRPPYPRCRPAVARGRRRRWSGCGWRRGTAPPSRSRWRPSRRRPPATTPPPAGGHETVPPGPPAPSPCRLGVVIFVILFGN